uniref:Uncharacterized protein n=1 Tax=Arundo donax TaxID=35708 RepID=A0A0A9EPT3_ARUDO
MVHCTFKCTVTFIHRRFL